MTLERDMDAPLLRTIAHEYISVHSGSDTLAANAMSLFASVNASLSGSGSVTPQTVKDLFESLATQFPAKHAPLDVSSRRALLANLRTLGEQRKDFTALLRDCRACVDYNAEPHSQAHEDKRKRFEALYRKVEELANPEGRARSAHLGTPRGEYHDLILFQLRPPCRRLLRWVERAALADMRSPAHHIMGDFARKSFEKFRLHPRTSDVDHSIAETVFTAVDKRNAWQAIEDMGVTPDEQHATFSAAAHTLLRVQNRSYVPTLHNHILMGIDDLVFHDSVPARQEGPSFEDMGDLQGVAETFYDQGRSMDDARLSSRQQDAHRPPEVSFEISGRSSGFSASSSNSQAKESAQGEASTQAAANVQRERGKFMQQLASEFGMQAIQFDSIDLGLTGRVKAEKQAVFDQLERAFYGRLPKKADFMGEDFHESFSRADTMLVALSYQPQGGGLPSATVRKLSNALCDMAQSRNRIFIDVWVDAVLASNVDLLDGNRTVLRMLPYLACDVVEVVGSDGEYACGRCEDKSTWMVLADVCADPRRKTSVVMDRSAPGYTLQDGAGGGEGAGDDVAAQLASLSMRDGEPSRRAGGAGSAPALRERLLEAARVVCRGATGSCEKGKEARKLALWAEKCLVLDRGLLLSSDEMAGMSTLHVDNCDAAGVQRYLQEAQTRGFMSADGRLTGSEEREWLWEDVWELLPGLAVASRREGRRKV